MIWWIVAIVALAFYLYLDTRVPKGFPPGPPVWPIVGNYLWYGILWLRFRSMKIVCIYAAKTYGPIITLKQGRFTQVIVSGKNALKAVATSKATEGRTHLPIYQKIYEGVGGILFANGQPWVQNKKVAVKILKELGFGTMVMESMISEETLCLASNLKEQSRLAGSKGVQMEHAFHPPVLNIIWHFIGGHKFKYDDPVMKQIFAYLNEYELTMINSGLILNALPSLRFIAPDFTGYTVLRRGTKYIRNYLRDLLRQHRKTFDPDNVRDLIDGLLKEIEENKNFNISDETIVDICFDMLLGGLDTAGNTMSFVIMYLILYPEIQKKVQEELDLVVGRTTLPSVSYMTRMPFTTATILEIQRMITILPVVPRMVIEDTEILGYQIPKGTTIWMNFYGVHMDEDHWKDSRVFRPERFLNDGQVINDDWMFLYGGGKRRCPGEHLSRITLFLVTTTLLQKFSFSVPPQTEPPSPKTLDGIAMRAKPFRAVITERS